MLVSIIIPSAGRRPELLKRAIKSALIDDKVVKTEIIVILNGIDGIAFNLDDAFQHSLVTYYKIEEGNVSKARNLGLSVSTGEIIRFLDDDDYLLEESIHQYYEFIENLSLDLNISAIRIEDQYGNCIKQVKPNLLNNSFIEYAFNPNIALPFAFVYRKNLIKNLKWDEECKLPEDEDWLRRVAVQNNISCSYSYLETGVWYQHLDERLSPHLAYNQFYRNKCDSIFELYNLKANKFYNSIVAKSLWLCIHQGFYFAPIYWTKMGLYARKLDPHSKPQEDFFDKVPYFIHPLVIEWLMLPKRWLTHQIRKLKNKLGLLSYIRKI